MKKNNMLLGLLLIVSGIFLGLYVGLYQCLFGGIMDIVDQINQIHNGNNLDPTKIAFSIFKIMFAGLFGWTSALFLLIPGYIMFGNAK